MAKGYVVVHLGVTDPAKFERYRGKVPGTIEQYGGRYLVRGGAMETLEGGELPPRNVIIEFESLEAAKNWYYSSEYQAIIGLRLEASHGHAQIVEGVD